MHSERLGWTRTNVPIRLLPRVHFGAFATTPNTVQRHPCLLSRLQSSARTAHLPDQRAQFYLDLRAPSPRVRFPTPIAAKAGPMPPHQRFRLNNRNDLQD